MSKRNKRAADRRPVQPPSTSLPESRARIEALIAAGKAREALDLAKQLFKETRSGEAEALLIAAYEARIHAMLARGLYDEAGRWPRWPASGSLPSASASCRS
jgi:hypothetical protein